MIRVNATGKTGGAPRLVAAASRAGSRGTAAVSSLSRCFAAIWAGSRRLFRGLSVGAVSLMTLVLSGCGAFNPDEAGAVGIIGGADGPTSIFLTFNGNPRASVALLVILGIAVVVSVVILIRRARKKKK